MSVENLAKHLLAGDFAYLIHRTSPTLLRVLYRASGKSDADAYLSMQKVVYDARSRIDARTFVVGNYEAHERYPYEDLLLRQFTRETEHIVAIDFGCGPGRMVRRMSKLVRQCDGIDISSENTRQAADYCKEVRPRPTFYVNNGADLAGVDSSVYDLVYSTITLQHIPVHEYRQKIFAEMFRVLKPGGRIAVQMAYSRDFGTVISKARQMGYPAEFAEWRDNAYAARDTNGLHDVVITAKSLRLVQDDLQGTGFQEVSYELAPLPHGSHYDNWIFIYGLKPR